MPSPLLKDYDRGVVLGIGTVGAIYLGTHRESGDQVAIKILHSVASQNPLIRARFKREMSVLERLRHPNIIAFYGGGEDDGTLYYIMELVKGGTVKELLESNGRLAWSVVVEISRQICSALQCAHNNGVIHRDLKPGNLFLTEDAEVKLGDFGIARDVTKTDLTGEGFTVGTHAYMAPEQITGDMSLSGKADLYALGCCMFEMLTGRKVFYGENAAQLFEQHLKDPPPRTRDLVGQVPDELDEVIAQLLAKKPEDRPFNARQVQGVMLRLGERVGIGDASASADSVMNPDDVGADCAAEIGHRILKQQIEGRVGAAGREVTWGKLLVLMALAVLAIAVAVTFGK